MKRNFLPVGVGFNPFTNGILVSAIEFYEVNPLSY